MSGRVVPASAVGIHIVEQTAAQAAIRSSVVVPGGGTIVKNTPFIWVKILSSQTVGK